MPDERIVEPLVRLLVEEILSLPRQNYVLCLDDYANKHANWLFNIRNRDEIVGKSNLRRRAGRNKVAEQVQYFKVKIDELNNLYNGFYQQTHELMFDNELFPHILIAIKQLEVLTDRLSKVDLNVFPHNPARGGQGARPYLVAWSCYDIYKYITGKKPTIIVRDGNSTGPFLDFVCKVFSLLSISRSAEVAARKAISRHASRTYGKKGSAEAPQ